MMTNEGPKITRPSAAWLRAGLPEYIHKIGDKAEKEEQVLGRGDHATVYRAWNKRDRCYVAVKAQHKHSFEQLRNEYDILKNVEHPRIVKVLAFGPIEPPATTGKGGKGRLRSWLGAAWAGSNVAAQARTRRTHANPPAKMYMLTELVQGKQLCKLTGAEACEYGAQIMQQLREIHDYLHGCDIYYRDLHAENVLWSKESGVTLIDFGGAVDHERLEEKDFERFLHRQRDMVRLSRLSHYIELKKLKGSGKVDK